MTSEFTLSLQDGELVDFRPVRPDDKEIIQNGMLALSSQSRYFRFFTPISKLSDAQLRLFTEIDQHNHVAWIALSHGKPECSGIGIARFIRIPDQPTVAEFAIVITDSYQKRGLGTFLLAILYQMANLKGIEKLRAIILTENRVMSGWLNRLGAIGLYENDSIRMDLTVGKDTYALPETITAKRFHDCIELIGSVHAV